MDRAYRRKPRKDYSFIRSKFKERMRRCSFKEKAEERLNGHGERWLSNHPEQNLRSAEEDDRIRRLIIFFTENGLFWVLPIIGFVLGFSPKGGTDESEG